jgi:RNA polymerase sigma factor (sigma-70 family)
MNTLPDKETFLRLIKDNEKIIFKICHSYCINKDDRADLAQEIICQLWQSYRHYNSAFKFSTWMYRVALNVSISFYRKGKRSVSTINLQEHLIESAGNDEYNERIEENITLLQQFIYGFRELDRALTILYLEEKSYREMAEIMGITETNVATRISRIKDKLKQQFATAKQS